MHSLRVPCHVFLSLSVCVCCIAQLAQCLCGNFIEYDYLCLLVLFHDHIANCGRYCSSVASAQSQPVAAQSQPAAAQSQPAAAQSQPSLCGDVFNCELVVLQYM